MGGRGGDVPLFVKGGEREMLVVLFSIVMKVG
jgi:hypothetical protein